MNKHQKTGGAVCGSLRPRRYGIGVRILSIAAFSWAIIAFLNESTLHIVATDSGLGRIILSHWTEYAIIAAFGTWRIMVETHRGSRIRLGILTVSVMIFWWILPSYFAVPEPYIGTLPKDPVLLSLHTPGTLTFFVSLAAVFLFGRRLICGYFCPCVGIRETVGFPFRINTPRSERAFRWKYLKWPFLIAYTAVTISVLTRSELTGTLFRLFSMVVVLPYYLSMLVSPFLGNRSYCRFVCPYGALFGLLNKVGFFSVNIDRSDCNGCGVCDAVCDMGIAISSEPLKNGNLTNVGECMGCGRCAAACPKGLIELRDFRHSVGRR